MRTKTVLRHYCDFCSRGSFKKPTTERHEKGCTMNPNRVCWLCETVSRDYPALVRAVKSECGEDEDHPEVFHLYSAEAFGRLSSSCNGCPACILSVLRQANVLAFDHFNYKEAFSEWHRDQFTGVFE